jgi:hypothetical protein
MSKKLEINSLASARKALLGELRTLSHSRHLWDIWRDWTEMMALAIANVVDLRQYQKREARYLAIAGRYDREDLTHFARAYALLVEAMEFSDGDQDLLGELFMELDLGNHFQGQFFTPIQVCKMMGLMTFGDDVKQHIAARGYFTANDPRIGGGAMIIGLASAMREQGFNPQKQLHVTGVDCDERSVHMAYVQLSLLYIPAVIVHGNSLTLDEHEHWYTPAHILDGWTPRLHLARAEQDIVTLDKHEIEEPPSSSPLEQLAEAEL